MSALAARVEREAAALENESIDAQVDTVLNLRLGQFDKARIAAQKKLDKTKNAETLRKQASQLESVASRMENTGSVQRMASMAKSATTELRSAMTTLNVETVSKTMDAMEKALDDVSVQTLAIDTTMKKSTTDMASSNEVDVLLMQMGQRYGVNYVPPVPKQEELTAKLQEARNEFTEHDRVKVKEPAS